MAEVTYYFTLPMIAGGWTGGGLMVDGKLDTFAYTSSDGDTAQLYTNNCPGTNLGTISKVELRVYGYGDGDDRIDLTPRFGSPITTGKEYQLTMPSSAGWSAYIDITNDPKAPSPWTWSDITSELLRCYVEFDKVGKANTMYCAKVEIRVTYTPLPPPPQISVNPTSHDFGTVDPSDTPATGLTKFTVTNNTGGGQAVDLKIKVGPMASTDEDWNPSQSATPGEAGNLTINTVVKPEQQQMLTGMLDNMHELIYYNGYIYGCTRVDWDVSGKICKIPPSNYSGFSTATPQHNATDCAALSTIISAVNYLWTADSDGWLYKIDPSDLSTLGSWEVAAGHNIQRLCYDGTYIWGCTWDGYVFKFNPSDLSYSSNEVVAGAQLHSMCEDGDYLYCGKYNTTYGLYKINKSDMTENTHTDGHRTTDEILQDATYVYVPTEDTGWYGIDRYKKSDMTLFSREMPGTDMSNGGILWVSRSLLLSLGYNNVIYALPYPALDSIIEWHIVQSASEEEINAIIMESEGIFHITQWGTSSSEPTSIIEIWLKGSPFGLKAGLSGEDYTIICKGFGTLNTLKDNLGDTLSQQFGLKLWVPTEFSNTNAKTGKVTVIAVLQGYEEPQDTKEITITATLAGAPPPEKVTQYLPGHDCPEFPHEMDLMADKLPCPPPYD